MNEETLRTRDQLAATYLQQLQALARELSVAMEAISSNAMLNFKESVAKQEMLCATLVSVANSFGEDVRSAEQPFLSGVDSAVEVKIKAASREVSNLNLQYSALLKHSGRSIALLASLCRSHTGQFQEARGPRLKHQTWSCEM